MLNVLKYNAATFLLQAVIFAVLFLKFDAPLSVLMPIVGFAAFSLALGFAAWFKSFEHPASWVALSASFVSLYDVELFKYSSVLFTVVFIMFAYPIGYCKNATEPKWARFIAVLPLGFGLALGGFIYFFRFRRKAEMARTG